MEELSCADHYRKLFEIVSGLSHNHPISTVLELGCADGYFVEFLRQKEFNVEGIDGNKKLVEGYSHRSNYLHHGKLTALEDTFGDRTFDLIIARGVFCKPSQIEYLAGSKFETVFALYVNDLEFHEEMNGIALENINKILVSAYQQLTSGGFLTINEDVTPLDSIDFTRETAENIGYIVEKLDKQEAVLQKPYQTNDL